MPSRHATKPPPILPTTPPKHWRYVRCKGEPTAAISSAVLALHDNEQIFRILSGDHWLYHCWQTGQPLYVQFTRHCVQLAQIAIFPTALQGMGRLAWLPKV